MILYINVTSSFITDSVVIGSFESVLKFQGMFSYEKKILWCTLIIVFSFQLGDNFLTLEYFHTEVITPYTQE